MRARLYVVAFVVLVTIGCFPALAFSQHAHLDSALQEGTLRATTATLSERLVRDGYVEVQVVQGQRGTLIRYENRGYRYETEALIHAWHLAGGEPSRGSVWIVPERDGVPLLAVRVTGTNDACTHACTPDVQPTRLLRSVPSSLVPGRPPAAHHRLRTELVVHPFLEAEFGEYGNAVRSRIGLAPALSTTLWRGARASVQWLLPVQNDLTGDGHHPEPVLMTLNQLMRLSGGTLLRLSAGLFTNDRYGVDVEAHRWLGQGRFSTGGRLGYTGKAAYHRGMWDYTSLNTMTGSAYVAHHSPRYLLTTRISYGRYLAGDTGWQVELVRSFGETRVGLFATYTGGEPNAGVALRIPLFMRRHAPPGAFRVRPADAFLWTYRFQRLPEQGHSYRTGHELDELLFGLEPAFIRHRWRLYRTIDR